MRGCDSELHCFQISPAAPQRGLHSWMHAVPRSCPRCPRCPACRTDPVRRRSSVGARAQAIRLPVACRLVVPPSTPTVPRRAAWSTPPPVLDHRTLQACLLRRRCAESCPQAVGISRTTAARGKRIGPEPSRRRDFRRRQRVTSGRARRPIAPLRKPAAQHHKPAATRLAGERGRGSQEHPAPPHGLRVPRG